MGRPAASPPSPAPTSHLHCGRTLHKTSTGGGLALVASDVGRASRRERERARSAVHSLYVGTAIHGTTGPRPPGHAGYSVDAASISSKATRYSLRDGSRVKPGDRLYLTVRASRPADVYVVKMKMMRAKRILYSRCPDRSSMNPLPAGRATACRELRVARSLSWQVTSAGGKSRCSSFS